MTESILDGVRVLDLAEGLAGSVAAMQLAEAGADVAKIEPPQGARGRDEAGFAVWNRSKHSVVLDVDDVSDRSQLDLLAAAADVLIHDYVPSRARALGLDDESLGRRFPHLIVASIGGFPAGHPEAETPVEDTLVLAASGIMDEQQPVRRDGPCYTRFPLGSWGAAYLALNGIMARLIVLRRGGAPGPVRTSLLQGAFAPVAMHWYEAETPTPALALGMPKDAAGGTLAECADGVWLHLMSNPDVAPLMTQALKERLGGAFEEPVKSKTYPNWELNVEIFKTRPSAEWLEDLWGSDVAVQPAVAMGEIYFDQQAQANDYVITVEDPTWGRTRQPGHPASVTPAMRVTSPAPRVGQHTAQVIQRWDEPRPQALAENRLRYPLEGIRVLDFGNFLAGPLAPQQLSDLGADVIKVEATTGDQMRQTEWAFTGCQRGKRSLALQLKDPKSREVLRRLVASADVLHHNLRMPAALRLGLGYEEMRAINPRLIYCHVSAYGPRGPRKDWPGYDQLFQASCGWEYEGAGTGNPPMWHRYGMMDHQCAMASLYATLLGVYHREATGEGQFVASSLLGACVLTCSETIVLPNGELAPYRKLDGQQMGVAPDNRLYVCRDGWVAVVARTEQAFAALRSFADAKAERDFEGAFAQLTVDEALARMRDAGVCAAPVRLDQRRAFFASDLMREQKLFAEYPHPEYGEFRQIGALWNFSNLDVQLHRAPPVLGQHTREVLAEVGYDAAAIDSLVSDEVVVAA